MTSFPEDNDSDNTTCNIEEFNCANFEKWHYDHWKIEQYHRTIKQVCNIESFQVRGKPAITTPICGYVEL
mgnify:CR=1 FL=1